MPRIPTRYPNTLGVPAELQQKPKEEHPASPVSDTRKKSEDLRQKLGLGKISLHNYEPDFDNLYRLLTGKEPATDAYTGQLVPAADPGAAAPPG